MQYLNELVVNNQLTARQAKTIREANRILERLLKCFESTTAFTQPAIVADYLRTHYLDSQREHFIVMFLDAQHRLIKSEILFHGTINSCSIYTRVIAQRALQYNAAAIILSHNHPSGSLEPSISDKELTTNIKNMVKHIDVQVLDHIIITSAGFYSFAENFLL